MADDFAASTATTGIVSVGGSITGNIETTGDVDWIKVNLIAGTTYQFDLRGFATGEGTLSTGILGLRDGSSAPVTPFISGGSPQFTYTALSSGDYFLSAQAGSTLQLGTYKVSVTQLSTTLADDFAASTATTGLVAVGGSITGNIETTGDVDWIKVNLIAGTTYQFDLRGFATGEGTLSTGILGLRDGSSAPVTPFISGGSPQFMSTPLQ